jgi:hypothetical protein
VAAPAPIRCSDTAHAMPTPSACVPLVGILRFLLQMAAALRLAAQSIATGGACITARRVQRTCKLPGSHKGSRPCRQKGTCGGGRPAQLVDEDQAALGGVPHNVRCLLCAISLCMRHARLHRNKTL